MLSPPDREGNVQVTSENITETSSHLKSRTVYVHSSVLKFVFHKSIHIISFGIERIITANNANSSIKFIIRYIAYIHVNLISYSSQWGHGIA
jgi:hypothetical protein